MSGNRNSFQLFWLGLCVCRVCALCGGVWCLLVYSRFSDFPWAGTDDFDIGGEPTIVFRISRPRVPTFTNVRKEGDRSKYFPCCDDILTSL
jgi:hypothetical protein